jgi:hypothetical protein
MEDSICAAERRTRLKWCGAMGKENRPFSVFEIENHATRMVL